MKLHERIILGTMLSAVMVMYGFILGQVGLNLGSIFLAPILFSITIFPYVYPESLMTYKNADKHFGKYIYSARSYVARKRVSKF